MVKECTFQFHEVAPYINWLYFFHAWGFPARLGSIAKIHGCEACRQNWLQTFNKEERTRAREAMRLYDDAQHLLDTLDNTYRTHALVALLPAYSEEDNIIVEIEDVTSSSLCQDRKQNSLNGKQISIPLLRQQTPSEKSDICLCLSDFVKPKYKSLQSADPLYNRIGVFACSVDRAMEEQHPNDEYLRLLHQTLADRLAEATAERMHEIVRKQFWGYAADESLTIEELFSEKYQGKRPAVGYPSLPDQSLNFVLDSILDFSRIGISLTENGAMRPHASTSGLMLSHPATMHFSIGSVGEDQIQEYAQRRGVSADEIKRFLK